MELKEIELWKLQDELATDIEKVFDEVDDSGIERSRSTTVDGGVYERYANRFKIDCENDIRKGMDSFVKKMKELKSACEYKWNGMFYGVHGNKPEVVLYWRIKPQMNIHDNMFSCHARIFVGVKSCVHKEEALG